MNVNELNAQIVRKGLTVPKLAQRIGMDKKTLYSRLKSQTSFKQSEISAISKELQLTQEDILNIFFADEVA